MLKPHDFPIRLQSYYQTDYQFIKYIKSRRIHQLKIPNECRASKLFTCGTHRRKSNLEREKRFSKQETLSNVH